MTRLITEWLTPIEQGMSDWDDRLADLTGYGLAGLAARAAAAPGNVAEGKLAAVVSITSGEGVIGDFARSIAAILQGIGMRVLVTAQTDVAGIYEAVRARADVVFLADDDRYIALNLKNGRVGENDLCTALGYRQLLEECNLRQTGTGLGGQPVLLMGYGRVGHIMYRLLTEQGAFVTVYDKDPAKQEELRSRGIPQIEERPEIGDYRLIVDLTSEGSWIDPAWLREDLIMAAPGVPLSLRPEDEARFRDRVIHDDLEIGTAVMAMAALAESTEELLPAGPAMTTGEACANPAETDRTGLYAGGSRGAGAGLQKEADPAKNSRLAADAGEAEYERG